MVEVEEILGIGPSAPRSEPPAEQEKARNTYRTAAFLLFLLGPASLLLGTGDPTNPSVIGIWAAVTSWILMFAVLARWRNVPIFFCIIVLVLALLTWADNPWNMRPRRDATVLSQFVYHMIPRAGAAVLLSGLAAFVLAFAPKKNGPRSAGSSPQRRAATREEIEDRWGELTVEEASSPDGGSIVFLCYGTDMQSETDRVLRVKAWSEADAKQAARDAGIGVLHIRKG